VELLGRIYVFAPLVVYDTWWLSVVRKTMNEQVKRNIERFPENITLALSELQAKEPKAKPRRRIGFIQI
jgi:hypothetical protein